MNQIHKRKIAYIIFFSIGISLATSLILVALSQNINLFLTPSEAVSKSFKGSYHFLLGGIVKKGSVVYEKKGLSTRMTFVVTDLKQDILVKYQGIVPDLFREGKGVIVEGSFRKIKKQFIAVRVLAKHDENYLPRY